jgi:hypothetical protein
MRKDAVEGQVHPRTLKLADCRPDVADKQQRAGEYAKDRDDVIAIAADDALTPEVGTVAPAMFRAALGRADDEVERVVLDLAGRLREVVDAL